MGEYVLCAEAQDGKCQDKVEWVTSKGRREMAGSHGLGATSRTQSSQVALVIFALQAFHGM